MHAIAIVESFSDSEEEVEVEEVEDDEPVLESNQATTEPVAPHWSNQPSSYYQNTPTDVFITQYHTTWRSICVDAWEELLDRGGFWIDWNTTPIWYPEFGGTPYCDADEVLYLMIVREMTVDDGHGPECTSQWK